MLDKRAAYTDALVKEAERRLPVEVGNNDIKSVYFGGGTPSLLELTDIERILSCIPHKDGIEITLEANPGDLTEDKLTGLRALGVNRLSMGIQSFNDENLTLLGRRHNAEDAHMAIIAAKSAGFDNISIDLMYGLPYQSMEEWEKELDEALKSDIQHISTYQLTYEEGTPLIQLLKSGRIPPTDDDIANDMFDLAHKKLTLGGFEHYEVSNFAKTGRRSRHNSGYWTGMHYIGLGAGAHSYDGVERSWNPNGINAYIHGITAQNLQRESEALTEEQKRIEKIMLGMRTIEGVDEETVAHKKTTVMQLLDKGLIERKNNRITATLKGVHILNTIIEELI